MVFASRSRKIAAICEMTVSKRVAALKFNLDGHPLVETMAWPEKAMQYRVEESQAGEEAGDDPMVSPGRT